MKAEESDQTEEEKEDIDNEDICYVMNMRNNVTIHLNTNNNEIYQQADRQWTKYEQWLKDELKIFR